MLFVLSILTLCNYTSVQFVEGIVMSMITKQEVVRVYHECIALASGLYCIDAWAVRPTGVDLDSHKCKYGQATPEGKVLVNPAFVGTSANAKLKETIFHELAHLIVGLGQHHNKVFHRVYSVLTTGLTVCESEKQEVKANNGYKYRLLAYCGNSVYDLGGAFRRSKTYTDYVPSNKYSRSIQGCKIMNFEYVAFNAPLPNGVVTEEGFEG